MTRRIRMAWGAVMLTLVLGSAASAGEGEVPHWHDKPHHLSLLVGGTTSEGGNGVTLALDYEYRVSELLGLGLVAEHTFDLDASTFLAVADIHLWRGLAVQTGPGLEILDGEDLFVYRVGMLYEFEIGEYTLSPQVHLDVTDVEPSLIFGVAAGFPF